MEFFIYSSFKNKAWISFCWVSPPFHLCSYSLWALFIECSQGAESKQTEKMQVCDVMKSDRAHSPKGK